MREDARGLLRSELTPEEVEMQERARRRHKELTLEAIIDRERARRRYDEALEDARRRYVPAKDDALGFVALGETIKALGELEASLGGEVAVPNHLELPNGADAPTYEGMMTFDATFDGARFARVPKKPDGARVGYWVGRSVGDILAEIPERVALLDRESGRADHEDRSADAVALGDTADLLGMLGAWLAERDAAGGEK